MMYLIMFFLLSLSHLEGMNLPGTAPYWEFFKYALWFNDASSECKIWDLNGSFFRLISYV